MKNYYVVKVNDKAEHFADMFTARKVYNKAKNDMQVFCGSLVSVCETKKLFHTKQEKFVIDNFWHL